MKKLIKSLLVIIFLSLFTTSTLAFADENVKGDKAKVSIESQKKEIDKLVKIGSNGEKELAEYKINDKELSEKQKKELIEYKSKASEKLKKKLEKDKDNEISPLAAGMLALGCFSIAIMGAITGLAETPSREEIEKERMEERRKFFLD